METLISRLKEASVKVAAVIDEAFDPPSPVTLGQNLDEFWTELEAKAQAMQQLRDEGVPCDSRDAFERDGLVALWPKRDTLHDPLAALVTDLFSPHIELLKDPEIVAKHLEALKLQAVHRVGAKGEVPAGTQLVFLDYNLENAPLKPGQRPRSVILARKFAGREGNAPFLVLFSSVPKLSGIAKRFRRSTGYLGGTFAFLSKEEARDQGKFCSRLTGFGVGHPVFNLTQQFFRALQDRLKQVARAVRADVMQLDVQDYAFIQELALRDDGAPLGEYLLEIFGTVLKYELQDGAEVQAARRKLDGLHFERHLPFTGQPSTPVRRMYRALVTEPGIGKAEPHAVAGTSKCKGDDGKEYPYPPLLMLGDIFAAAGAREVYVVVNPACELQYSPKNKRRQPDLRLTVHLMQGSLVSPRKGIGKGPGKRMELLELENQLWRVMWHPERVLSVTLGEFSAWQWKTKYDRVARLTLPFALALQQYWTSQLGRVGLPVNLPFFDDCSFQLYRPKEHGGWQKVGKVVHGEIVLARHPRDREELMHFTLTRSGCDRLQEELKAAATALAGVFPSRSKAALHLLEDWAFWTDLTEVPRGFQMQEGWFDKSKEAVVFKWESAPQNEEVGKFQKAALVVVLKRKFHIV